MNQETLLCNAMNQYGDAVYRLALCRLRNQTDAEDVYQEVFLRLLREPEQDWEPEHLKAWLLRTALHRCADVGRFRLRWKTVPLDAVTELAQPEGAGAPELWDAVGRLPEKLRTVVHLYFGEGYRTEEIAYMVGVPSATVRTRLHRAKRKLKDLLGGIEDDEEQLSENAGEYPYPGRAQ